MIRQIFRENPVLVGIAGLCPAIAASTNLANSLLLGVGTLMVLLMSGLISFVLKRWIPDPIAKGAHIMVAAGLTAMVQLVADAYFPEVAESLGIFIGLIAVNCILVDSIGYIRTHKLWTALKFNMGLGLGYLLVLVVMGAFREIGGSGTLLGNPLLEAGLAPNSLLMMVPGGLLLMSILTALTRWLVRRGNEAKKGGGIR